MNDDQTEVIAFLGSPAATSEGGSVARIDTHGAHIFLSERTALKLKRAVTYDYMDLSTVELRHRMLVRELELNAPAAPSIYCSVLPVTRGRQGLRLGGDGPVVDWVLRMNRFPAEHELEAMAERGALDGGVADALGRMTADYHSRCPAIPADGPKLIHAILDELGRVFGEYQGAAGTACIGEWLSRARAALTDVAPLLARRGRLGHVRRGHGDLHLRNIVMIDGRPVPFDALEFDETLGTCDVLYDLAFLLMDLCRRDLREAACRSLSEYLLIARGGEDEGLTALPLFLSVRSAIRAMVLLQTDQAQGRGGASEDEVRAYLAQAIAVLAPAPARLIAVAGVSGTGKTVLARALAPGLGASPGAVHLSTDAERKVAHGSCNSERLPPDAYAATARGAVYDTVLRRAENILQAGYSVVVDGTFLDPERRMAVKAVGARLGVPTACLWLTADAETLRTRIDLRRGDASDADVAVLEQQLHRVVAPADWVVIDASGDAAATVAAAQIALGRS